MGFSGVECSAYCSFQLGVSILKTEHEEKGTLIIKGLLKNLEALYSPSIIPKVSLYSLRILPSRLYKPSLGGSSQRLSLLSSAPSERQHSASLTSTARAFGLT